MRYQFFKVFANTFNKHFYKTRHLCFSSSIQRDFSSAQYHIKSAIYKNAYQYWDHVAVEDKKGAHTYGEICTKSLNVGNDLSALLGEEQKHIATLLPNDVSYVISQWATWRAGHVAVPLHPKHPASQLEYYVRDSKASLVITNRELASKFSSLLSGQEVIVLENEFLFPSGPVKMNEDEVPQSHHLGNREVDRNLNALIIYTSGTTGPPKGVVLTHGNIQSQVQCLLNAWGWSSRDVLLHCLPLHHVHGIVNGLLCPLYCGAKIVMELGFDASTVWSKLLNLGTGVSSRVNLFMAVPTIYVKLIEEYEKKFKTTSRKEFVKQICMQNIRLMVSGSAPLPEPIFMKWKEITGRALLERYGMTEIGMALSNPLKEERLPGFVGNPLPGVRVKIVRFSPKRDSYETLCEGSHEGTDVTPGMEEEIGELLVKGPSVFREYWRKEEATKKEFTEDGWFCTGDTAAFIGGNYKILGRTSVDIIKSGGFKISALDVERQLLCHPNIKDVAVVGLPDITWGEKVAALIVWDGDVEFVLSEFRSWAKEKLPSYQVPSVVKPLSEPLPRNNMGKVNKREIVKQFFSTSK